MVKTILLTLLAVFAISGICELLYIVRMLFFMPKKRFNSYMFVVLQSENALKQLNFIWQKILWHGDIYANGIIAVADNLSADEKKQCSEYINGKNIFLCSINDIPNNINLQGEILNGKCR